MNKTALEFKLTALHELKDLKVSSLVGLTIKDTYSSQHLKEIAKQCDEINNDIDKTKKQIGETENGK